MNQRTSVLKMLLVALMLAPAFLFGQTSKSIFFDEGKNSSYVTGSVTGSAYVDYKLNVLAGQTLTVSLNSKSTSVFFNVLPPGSQGEAIYNSSNDGNKYSGVAAKSGTFAIRIYQMGAAESENRTSNFGLTVGLAKASTTKTKSTTGGSPKFNATGNLRSALGSTSMNCKFGVIRTSTGAEVHATMQGKSTRIFVFSAGEWICTVPGCNLTFAKVSSDEWELICNGTEKYYIPDAVITGG